MRYLLNVNKKYFFPGTYVLNRTNGDGCLPMRMIDRNHGHMTSKERTDKKISQSNVNGYLKEVSGDCLMNTQYSSSSQWSSMHDELN